MNRYTFVFLSENQNAFSANAVVTRSEFHKTLKYVDEFSELKKNDEHTSLYLSLSLLVDLSMQFDFHQMIYMYQSLSLFLYLHLQKRLGSRSDPNGVQERMFRQFKNLCMQ